MKLFYLTGGEYELEIAELEGRGGDVDGEESCRVSVRDPDR